MQACPFCASQIQEGLTSCPYCNENLLRHPVQATGDAKHPCPHCGESIDTGSNICKYCGLATVAPPPRPPDRRPCPYCAESIMVASLRCRYCGGDVANAPDPNAKRPCPHCKEPIAASEATCRYCGHDLRMATPAGPKQIDWEDSKRNVFARWWTTWAGTQFGMDRFWRAVPYEGGYGKPTRYIVFMAVQVLILSALCIVPFGLFMLFAVMSEGKPPDNLSQIVGFVLIGIVVAVPLALGLSVVLAYMLAGVQHVFVLLLGGKNGFEATYRVMCYALGGYVWGLIPYAGGPIHLAFHLIACTHGLAHAHGFSKGRAFAAAFLPIVASCGLTAGSFVAMMALA